MQGETPTYGQFTPAEDKWSIGDTPSLAPRIIFSSLDNLSALSSHTWKGTLQTLTEERDNNLCFSSVPLLCHSAHLSWHPSLLVLVLKWAARDLPKEEETDLTFKAPLTVQKRLFKLVYLTVVFPLACRLHWVGYWCLAIPFLSSPAAVFIWTSKPIGRLHTIAIDLIPV